MKRTRAEAALPPCKAAADHFPAAKAPRRQKPAATARPAAPERARSAENSSSAGMGSGGDGNSLAASAAAPAASTVAGDLIQLPSLHSAEAEAGMGWAAAELGEWWWWCLSGVEEEKLSGWFPFVDEDFFFSDSRGGGEAAVGGLLWEEADHDIWQLQHIHEIPQTASK